jgi:hypothetical protein
MKWQITKWLPIRDGANENILIHQRWHRVIVCLPIAAAGFPISISANWVTRSHIQEQSNILYGHQTVIDLMEDSTCQLDRCLLWFNDWLPCYVFHNIQHYVSYMMEYIFELLKRVPDTLHLGRNHRSSDCKLTHFSHNQTGQLCKFGQR